MEALATLILGVAAVQAGVACMLLLFACFGRLAWKI